MLQIAYLLAKIGADTAENERDFAEILPKCAHARRGRPARRPRRSARPRRRRCPPAPTPKAVSGQGRGGPVKIM